MLFYSIYLFLIIQRLIELAIANKNEKWMKRQGAIEVGSSHYLIIVLIHFSFFLSLFIEVVYFNRLLSTFWISLFIVFLFVQMLRIWVIVSLGKYWNTKIIILPQSRPVTSGPYQFIRHPNYLVVILEFLVIPLMFNAYVTAVSFSILNIIVLSFRISIEEKALIENTNYGELFQMKSKMISNLIKKN